MTDDPVARGVELLSKLEDGTLSLAEAIDRIEVITTDPNTQRAILERAVATGVIEREGDTITITSRSFLRFGAEVTTKTGAFTCRRCGTGITTGYFIHLEAGEVGPFGSSCIRKVTGRE